MRLADPLRCDALVVGGGLAGLYAVLHLRESWDVVVVDKGTASQAGSSPLAQGGMAVAAGPGDSPDLHAQDTLRAGAGLGNAEAVRVLVTEAPDALDELVRLGCALDRGPDGSLHLNREGGQSVARSAHRADATGREIMRVVVGGARHRARRLTGIAVRLLLDEAGRCAGAAVARDGALVPVVARAVLLAAGGCGALYRTTTNTPGSTGDAAALAHLAGARLTDLEFVQFHPTALAAGDHQRILLTEALRGDGAIVVDAEGKRFLFDHHPDGELAPRDVVARAIAARGGALLDARPIGAGAIHDHFPNIHRAVLEAGFDLALEPVPVSPAAHYWLGGVATDVDGRTSLPGLYAAGECAATGVHGANRMAGNSLTEAVVFGRRAALAMAREAATPGRWEPPAGEIRREADSPEAWPRLREAMWTGAGLVRTEASLRALAATAEAVEAEARSEALRLAAMVGRLVAGGALARRASVGVHFRADA